MKLRKFQRDKIHKIEKNHHTNPEKKKGKAAGLSETGGRYEGDMEKESMDYTTRNYWGGVFFSAVYSSIDFSHIGSNAVCNHVWSPVEENAGKVSFA